MSLITQNYKDQIQTMQDPFNRGSAMRHKVQPFIDKYKPKSLIDFGCSQGSLHEDLSDVVLSVAGIS